MLYCRETNELKVNIIRAKNLRAKDKNGFSDPYVKMYLLPGPRKATKLNTKTIPRTLNPEWNEHFIYYGISEEDRQKKTLRMLVMDKDSLGSDFLGECRVPLKKLCSGMEKNFNLYLDHAMPVEKVVSTSERGKILVGLTYNAQQGLLYVSIRKCVELIGLDASGFSDPYVKVTITPMTARTQRQKTATKKKTLNPEFNETFAFSIPLSELPTKTLKVEAFDYDVAKHDDYIGGVTFSASAKGESQRQWLYCMQNPGSLTEVWHKLALGD